MRNEKANIFNTLLDTFENEDIKNFAKECIDTIPDYFWNVGASSTGKYHPQYALGDLGLARHTCALVRFLNHILNIDCYKDDFTSRERDLLRVAGIMHDSRKSGDDDDYARSKFTKFDHPIMAANEVRTTIGFIPEEEVELVAATIESHMGQWNTDKRSKVVLPLPETKHQKLLHLADYLASRKDIEILFDYNNPAPQPDINTYAFTFGKYKGQLIKEVAKEHKDYLAWMRDNMTLKDPLQSFVLELLK